VKGTRLWQGPGSPLIQGRSRQTPPFWRPWLLAIVIAMIGANFVSWALLHAQPIEFFLAGSVAGSALGVWLARRMGWRSPWVLGVIVGAVADAAFLSALLQVDPAGLIEIAKVF
jgi:hypothetical protein